MNFKIIIKLVHKEIICINNKILIKIKKILTKCNIINKIKQILIIKTLKNKSKQNIIIIDRNENY